MRLSIFEKAWDSGRWSLSSVPFVAVPGILAGRGGTVSEASRAIDLCM